MIQLTKHRHLKEAKVIVFVTWIFKLFKPFIFRTLLDDLHFFIRINLGFGLCSTKRVCF